MVLVPIDMLEQMKKVNLTPLLNPNKDQVVKEMNEMSSILSSNLPESLKASRFNESVKNYSTFANKLSPTVQEKPQPPTAQPNDMFNSLPSTYRTPANVLMKELQKHPNVIQWDPATHEVTVEGRILRGSNIVDLIGDVMRTRKSAKLPAHGNSFLQTLAKLNLPESFVKNKYRISQFRSYKHVSDSNDDDDDDDETPLRRLQVSRARCEWKSTFRWCKTFPQHTQMEAYIRPAYSINFKDELDI